MMMVGCNLFSLSNEWIDSNMDTLCVYWQIPIPKEKFFFAEKNATAVTLRSNMGINV